MSTAALPQVDPDEYVRASVVKVWLTAGATRSTSPVPVPHYRDTERAVPEHLGIYGYRREFLFRVAAFASPSRSGAARAIARAPGGIPDPRGRRRARLGRCGHPEDLKAVEERVCGRKGGEAEVHLRDRWRRLVAGKGTGGGLIGALMEARGLKITMLKLDPYITWTQGR